ncbi:hypothetical protein [Thermophilibacter immobilis]|jgi:2,4-dienoyl-CoA reductase-like NADH-dependent reductase (Old Yellow Enzyme family)|nr:hypothetical protein [Thermophilibacter immobilis]
MTGLTNAIRILNLTLSNRPVMPPFTTKKANPDGSVSDELLHHYE